ncbi:MAG: beta-propeller domain-containing protein [Clostridiaceae bacterium]|nr:beta-propeller domain-containing protein [Clostridiaceae bacterium]
MKRLAVFLIAITFFLSACSGPAGQSSPSVSFRDSEGTVSGVGRSENYAGLLELIRQAQNKSASGKNYFTTNELSDQSATGAIAAEKDAAQSAGGARDGTDYSSTNVQVAGVDEADIIKTDGRYLYLVANNRLYVVDAQDPAQMKLVSTQTFKVSTENDKTLAYESPVELYLDTEHQRLVLLVTGSIATETAGQRTETTDSAGIAPLEASVASGAAAPDSQGTAAGNTEDAADAEKEKIAADAGIAMPYYQYRQYTTVRVYDIQDKAAPVIVRQFTLDGYYMTSRKIDSALYLVTNQYSYNLMDPSVTAKDAESGYGFPATSEDADLADWTTLPADKITVLPEGDMNCQVILAGIDTLEDSRAPDVRSIIGSSGTVYASTGYLYIGAWKSDWDGQSNSVPVYSTEIYRFKLAGAALTEAGKGTVPGSIINQFSMDEYDGYFRIATTTGEAWTKDEATTSKNNLYILDGSLNIAGQITGLAPGETIKSVRFMGQQAYVVTFRNVDPLFVMDLSNPKAPVVRGQLKIPGYSSYLHPYDDNLLLGFGYDVKTEGENAYNMGLKVSLFDISNFDSPKELSTIVLGGRGSYADILYNHKSLLFSRSKNLIAFPVTLTGKAGKNEMDYTNPTYQGLLILSVGADNQLSLRGSVTHFDKLSDPLGQGQTLTEKETQAFYGYDAITRGAYIDDVLYTFSARQIRATGLTDLQAIGAVELPGYDDAYQSGYYYGRSGGIAID